MRPSMLVLRAHHLRERLRRALLGWIVRRKLDRIMRRIENQGAHGEVADCLQAILHFEPGDYTKEQLVAAYRHAAAHGLHALRRTSCGRAS